MGMGRRDIKGQDVSINMVLEASMTGAKNVYSPAHAAMLRPDMVLPLRVSHFISPSSLMDGTAMRYSFNLVDFPI